MRFAVSLPWWSIALLAAAILLLAGAAYARPAVPLPGRRRLTLFALRGSGLVVVAACLLRPVAVLPPESVERLPVPVLIDTSRSMGLEDAGGTSRIAAARRLLTEALVPSLSSRFDPEIWSFGEDLVRLHGDAPAADASRTELAAALRAITERYRDRNIPGIVVISDGGDTGAQDAADALGASAAPVFTIGVGDADAGPDVEVVEATAGEPVFAGAAVDLVASVASRGGADAQFDVRILENGQTIDVRHVATTGAGVPVQVVFSVSPSPDAATLYTVEVPPVRGERVLENNRRTILVEAPGRRRRLLVVEGAPGFEHSFVKRALVADNGLEVDSVVRKGRDAQGRPTYFVHAAEDRAPRLTTGFPENGEALFQYDAIVLANVERDALSPPQLELAADFVNRRGGGLLVLGAKSFGLRGLAGTPVENVLPLGLNERDAGVVQAATFTRGPAVIVTTAGESHPVMRIGSSADETSARWKAVPPLAATAALGVPRPGATVLALADADREQRPLVAVQRYGNGRSMVFTGEASWRWRMQLPAEDRTFERFWRQTARWLAAGAAEPVAVAEMRNLSARAAASIDVEVRDRRFQPAPQSQVTMRVVQPDGTTHAVTPTLARAEDGRYVGPFHFGDPGVYRVQVEARDGQTMLGTAERWVLVGGVDAEMADPRLNDRVLRRISAATGGQYLKTTEVAELASLLGPRELPEQAPRLRELWQSPWIFATIVLLFTAEWWLRRRWGLR